jgi:hypothetical protein
MNLIVLMCQFLYTVFHNSYVLHRQLACQPNPTEARLPACLQGGGGGGQPTVVCLRENKRPEGQNSIAQIQGK